jgi:hypothetical protein
MEFYDTLDQVMHLLRSRGRVSYRALRLQSRTPAGKRSSCMRRAYFPSTPSSTPSPP